MVYDFHINNIEIKILLMKELPIYIYINSLEVVTRVCLGKNIYMFVYT